MAAAVAAATAAARIAGSLQILKYSAKGALVTKLRAPFFRLRPLVTFEKLMSYSPLTLKRRHVLGDLYATCDAVVQVPVYENDLDGEVLGYVDEMLGHYRDALSFHLAEDVCKRLASGQYTYSFGYEYSDPEEAPGRARRVKLTYICLTSRKPVEPVGPRARKRSEEAAGAVSDRSS